MKDFILKLARETIETYVTNGKKIVIPKDYPEEMNEERGVFVTLYERRNRELRGCMGIPYPEMSLIEALIEASVCVCTDPRFPQLSKEELKNIFIEVSILTKPEPVKAKDIKKEVKIGKHGLIIKKGFQGGLFLPQVPVEQNWSMDEYLENLCYKAGLTADSWLDPDCKLYKFETEIFKEA
jgi:uncharacterized protein (TIGR00296 family)